MNNLGMVQGTQKKEVLERPSDFMAVSDDLIARVEDLESKLEDLEAVLAAMVPAPRRRPWGLFSWLRSPLHRAFVAPGSTFSARVRGRAGVEENH